MPAFQVIFDNLAIIESVYLLMCSEMVFDYIVVEIHVWRDYISEHRTETNGSEDS